MDSSNSQFAKELITTRYVDLGMENIVSTRKLVANLLSNRRIPEKGWDVRIFHLLSILLAPPPPARARDTSY